MKTIKDLGWRPPKFKTPKELQEKINDYFKCITIDELVFNIDEDTKNKIPRLNNAWKQIIKTKWLEIPSILWLCLHLKIHRSTLIDYEEKDGFSNTTKEAKQIIENYTANLLHRKEQVTWIIFNLKNNFDWKDKSEVDNNINWSLSLTDLHKSTKIKEIEENSGS